MDNKYVNAIEMVGVTKTFGSVIANKEVDLTIRKGEILSLLGENGSGKTSLMNMLAGIYYPDKGQIFVNGKEVVIKSPIDAYNNKIGMVHQHFKLIDLFTAADNIILGETEPPFNYKEKLDSLKEEKARLIEEYKETKQNQEIEGSVVEKRGKQKFTDDIKWKRFLMNLKISSLPLARLWHKIKFNWLPRKRGKKIQDFADKYGFEIDVNKKIYDMSVSEKQTVEIIKVLYRGADVLILDEPTAVLTPQEIEKLFDVLRGMRDSGKSIIIITHKLNEVMAISDRVSVLRKGEFVGTVNTSETNETQLTEMMVGEKVELDMGRTIPENVRRRLEVQGLSCRTRMGVLALDNVSFNVNSGEILGIAGISGSGQRELLEAIAGLQKIEQGAIQYYEPETEKIVDLDLKLQIKLRI